MKRFHGLSRARGWGLRSILFQAKLTAIAVNLKRIAALSVGFLPGFYGFLFFAMSAFDFSQISVA